MFRLYSALYVKSQGSSYFCELYIVQAEAVFSNGIWHVLYCFAVVSNENPLFGCMLMC